ncbi:MAG: hypothetical protein F6K29_34935 [Okeania sp. SIO2G5]|nr:hypothetical protein [Okeania sp. SIO2G5]
MELAGWQRQQKLIAIDDMNGWVSPLLQIRFVLEGEELEIYRPDGRKFLTTLELEQRAEQEKQRAEQERQRAEQEKQRADTAEKLLAKYRDRFGSLD